MEKDVACGMQIDPAKAAGTSQYGGKTYYFCSNAAGSWWSVHGRSQTATALAVVSVAASIRK
jgi:hypothetical protein